MDFKSQYVLSKNIGSSTRNTSMFDLKGLLELIHTNNDINLQLKLFATLSAYVMSNEANIEEIITYNSLYDKICNLLSDCPARKAIVLFNFLSALLYTVDEDCKRNSLVAYAKNMIRSSGCLSTMCELFTGCMMHQDAWRSLCRCLAETCRNMEANQSYCTHLIPTCVQRCSQRNMEVLLVLQSLLQNHAKNVSLFIECNGICLFQREALQHDVCLQLLNTLVQSSKQAIELINRTDVIQYLRDFLHLYGPQSQLGQWATIILYHILGTKGTYGIPNLKHQITNVKPMDTSIVGKSNFTDTTTFIRNVMNEIQLSPQSDLNYVQDALNAQLLNKQKNSSYYMQNASVHSQILRNTIWMQGGSPKFIDYKLQNNLIPNCNLQSEGVLNKKTGDLSFSFLFKKINKRYSDVTTTTNKINELFPNNLTKSRNASVIYKTPRARGRFSQHETPELSSFAPKFASTPKKHDSKKADDIKSNHSKIRLQNSTRRFISNTIRKHDSKRRVRRSKNIFKTPKRLEQTMIDKETKQRSISGWLFEAVNESCTTLVKTVKNIFRPKNSFEETKAKSLTPIADNTSCSYSFTRYMRKRDAILKSECAKKFNVDFEDLSMEMSNSCSTCNNTTMLKQKLASDEYLKQTVRKLKLGINLYGCDFKKISRQLWPNQTYMTPVVLYNLYRKLIIK